MHVYSLYDTNNAIELKDLQSVQKERMPMWKCAEAENMKFYPCKSMKKVLILDQKKIDALKADLGSEAAIEEGGRVSAAAIALPSNQEVLDYVQQKIKEKPKEWELVEVMKIGVFARLLKGNWLFIINGASAGKSKIK